MSHGPPSFEFGLPSANWPYVTLRTRAAVGFEAQWWNACAGLDAVAWRVDLPHGGGSLRLPLDGAPTCIDPTRPSSIYVGPFGAGH